MSKTMQGMSVACYAEPHKEVVVKSDDGKHKVVIAGFANGVGVWVHGERSDLCVHFVSIEGQRPYLGFHNGASACPLAFTLDEQGKPMAQIVKDGQTHFIDLTKLVDLLK